MAQPPGHMVPPMGHSAIAGPAIATVAPQPARPTNYVKPLDNSKEKCRNFLANLLDLSSKEPPSVEMNVRRLIQQLVDSQVEPEQFCQRLESLLNASPQPCLIGFLKKTLPLLRQSLVARELTIEGITPPAPHLVFAAIQPRPPTVIASTNIVQLRPQVRPSGTIAVLQNIPVHTKLNVNKAMGGKVLIVNNRANLQRPPAPVAALSTVITPGKSLLKDKDKKTVTATAAHYVPQPFVDDKMAGDDDINDVAAMGGVNLAEETQRILGSTERIGTQIRSCKEEYLIPLGIMQARVRAIVTKHNLNEPSVEVGALLSHALQEHLKTMVEKLSVIAQHRLDVIKSDNRYEVTQDVKGQLKFLEELDRAEKKRRDESEREVLMRAAKSRSKTEDPEQAKLKAMAKEMQRAELEEIQQREANLTALQAIGPRKKPRIESTSGPSAASGGGPASRSVMALRTRMKRITHRDMIFLLEKDKDTAHSTLLYKSYLK